ncbi:hypothetical protein D9M72_384640 [compost metagenome]
MQRLPIIDRHLERLALRRARLVLDIFEGGFVRRDQAGAGAAFDRHVADGHAAFHRQRADRLAGKFDDVAGTAGRADLADDGEDDVLGGDAGRQLAVDAHQHVLRLLLDQRLGGEHVLDLGRADAMGQRTEGAVRRSVAVTADDGHARQGEALLRADDVHDALALVVLGVVFDAELGGVLGQRLDLDAAFLVLDAEVAVRRGRNVVVDDGKRLFRGADLAAGHAQAFEGLRARHFVNEVTVDVEKTGAVFLFVDQVVVPDFVIEGTRCAHGGISIEFFKR